MAHGSSLHEEFTSDDPFMADNRPLEPPSSAPFLARELSSSNVSRGQSTPSGSDGFPGTPTPYQTDALLGQREEEVALRSNPYYRDGQADKRPFLKRPIFWLLASGALVIVVLAVILPVYFTVIKPNSDDAEAAAASSGGSNGGGGSTSNPQSPTGDISGGDGSIVIMENGTQFTYTNPYGGFWYQDPANPFQSNAAPNSWTPPLNQTWDWSTTRIYGVNLGGWFVLEPFITPYFFQKYPGTVDEWTLSEAMANDTTSGGLQQQLENHYDTFITEQDFAQIAGAGLNWVRVPIPYWAIDKWGDEPFLAGVCWKYILRMLSWARKYGLRVNLDLHTAPGSQNGYNHSGKLGNINFLNGVMGMANAERMLNYIRIIAEFIAQPEYQNVIPIFSIINEPLLTTIGQDQLSRFYLEAYTMIRLITGYGEGKGPYIAFHDGFQGPNAWKNFLPGADRFVLDLHEYFAFGGTNTNPIAVGEGSDAGGQWPVQACSVWGPQQNQSQADFGVTIAGEFSSGFNGCGLFLNGVGNDNGPECDLWLDSSSWNQTVKEGLMQFTLASMDALQDWFYWTWKIGNSSDTNSVQCPLWSYQLGLENGWIPQDPRTHVGKCGSLSITGVQASYSYQPWQTGGAGAGTIDPTASSSLAWPPPTISNLPTGVAMSALPAYTATGSVITLSPPSITGQATKTISMDGWADPSDTAAAYTEISGCQYPDPWAPSGLPPACTGGARKRLMADTSIPELPSRR